MCTVHGDTYLLYHCTALLRIAEQLILHSLEKERNAKKLNPSFYIWHNTQMLRNFSGILVPEPLRK
jgi:hypothetical protein